MRQTRLAVIEDGELCELYYERPGMEKLAGNIYLGRVENVLPGMNAAFVDIGLDKNGFLYAGDIRIDTRSEHGLADQLSRARIERMIRPGQEILVQVVKEPGGSKGPRISSHVTLPGRLMVLMPDVNYIGVSRKISGDAERARLYEFAHGLLKGSGMGVILRTAAEGVDTDTLTAEYQSMLKLWEGIRVRASHVVAPRLIHSDGSLVLRAVRDRLNEETEGIWADGSRLYDALRQCAGLLAPEWVDRIHLHSGATPLFDLYRVDAQADKCSGRHVWLKSGGSLVIEETEALTVIDVNTGKFVGKKSLDETIFQTNCEAAMEIMRQIRLRDLGGIIIIDFIDMDSEARKQELLEIMRTQAERDRNHTNIIGLTELGLVEMTRKKKRRPLSKQLMHICDVCGGNGIVPSHETTARRVVRDIWRKRRLGENNPILAEAAAPVVEWIESIGVPEGGPVYLLVADDLKEGAYRLSPADETALPPDTKLLK